MRNKCEANHVLYRDGVYYYVRRVPYDLRGHHDGLSFFVQSLKTHEAAKAEASAIRITRQLDTLWAYFRNPDDRSIPLTLRQRATAFLESHGFEPGEAKKPLSKIDHELGNIFYVLASHDFISCPSVTECVWGNNASIVE